MRSEGKRPDVESRQCSSSSCTGNHHDNRRFRVRTTRSFTIFTRSRSPRAALNVRSRKHLELSRRIGFLRCMLNGLGDMKNVSGRRVNTSRKTEKKSPTCRHFSQSVPQVRWCMICMYFLNMFCKCQLCKVLSVICKHILGNDNKKSATFYDFVLVFKCLSQTF